MVFVNYNATSNRLFCLVGKVVSDGYENKHFADGQMFFLGISILLRNADFDDSIQLSSKRTTNLPSEVLATKSIMARECATPGWSGWVLFFLFFSTFSDIKHCVRKNMTQSKPSVFGFFLGVLPPTVISLILKPAILLFWRSPDERKVNWRTVCLLLWLA